MKHTSFMLIALSVALSANSFASFKPVITGKDGSKIDKPSISGKAPGAVTGRDATTRVSGESAGTKAIPTGPKIGGDTSSIAGPKGPDHGGSVGPTVKSQSEIAPKPTVTTDKSKPSETPTTTSGRAVDTTKSAAALSLAGKNIDKEMKGPASIDASKVEGGAEGLAKLTDAMKADLARVLDKVDPKQVADVTRSFDELMESILADASNGKGPFLGANGKLDPDLVDKFMKSAADLAAASLKPAEHMRDDKAKLAGPDSAGYVKAYEIYGEVHAKNYAKTYGEAEKNYLKQGYSVGEAKTKAHEDANLVVNQAAKVAFEKAVISHNGQKGDGSKLFEACVLGKAA